MFLGSEASWGTSCQSGYGDGDLSPLQPYPVSEAFALGLEKGAPFYMFSRKGTADPQNPGRGGRRGEGLVVCKEAEDFCAGGRKAPGSVWGMSAEVIQFHMGDLKVLIT